jgi:hypothetical protein
MGPFAKLSMPTVAGIIRTVDQSPLVSYAVDANLCLMYCNPAWNRFAADNGAPELVGAGALGTDLRRVMGEDLRPFYLHAFEWTAQSGEVWECLYECSSPQAFRKFQMRIHPLRPAGWSLITNAPVIERPHTGAVTTGLTNYTNSDAQIALCSHCRGSRRTDGLEQWDFVPAHLERTLDNISHTLCPLCRAYFYPEAGNSSGRRWTPGAGPESKQI